MLPILIILLFGFFAPISVRATATNDMDYLAKMIACDEKDERYVAEVYDAFLTLSAGRELKAGELRFPIRMVEKQGDFILIERAFYVSPNELRGFELFIPKTLLAERKGLVVSKVPLSVAQTVTRQGITSFTLQSKAALKKLGD